jgi:Uma2 family endonuclease
VSTLESLPFGSDRLRPLTRAEYDRMIEIGLFDEDEHVELLEGILVAVSPQGAPHAYAVQNLTTLLVRSLAGRSDAIVRPQLPLALGADSEPEPDVAVVPPGDYAKAHPTQALLVVEIAHDSATKDRQWKARIYARAAIPEYWVVDLKQRCVHVHREPLGDTYARVTREGDDSVLRPLVLEGIEIAAHAVLPPR